MKNTRVNDLFTPHTPKLWRYLRGISPLLISSMLAILYLWLLPPAVEAKIKQEIIVKSSQQLSFNTTEVLSASVVRVYSETMQIENVVSHAVVYRLPVGQAIGAKPLANQEEVLRTDLNGFLEWDESFLIGDQLVALLPITNTDSYTLYHTSAAPTLTGLDMLSVTAPETMQELVVSAEYPLILFNLDVSLEWDARHDPSYLTQLERDLERTSQILYDLTNGQVALGEVRLYQAKENWLTSHLLIYASNSLRPNADLGGVVSSPLSETLSSAEIITNAYVPGQVRMGAVWNRFGNSSGNLGEDWPRTLAHELGHYLFFLPDNYLGLSSNGLLTQVNCQGSAMTDPYREDYSEFLMLASWSGECLHTFAEHTTGRPDWGTLTTFYDMLNAESSNEGPSNLPLLVTNVTFVEPDIPANTLSDPFFYLTDDNNSPLPLPNGRTHGYLFKTRGTPELTDDTIVAVGSPTGDLLQARGVEPGDRLCVFDYNQDNRRLGCNNHINQGSVALSLHEVPGWEPDIAVTSLTSRTLMITVTQSISSGHLYVQVFPPPRLTSTVSITAPVAVMTPIGSDIFTQTLTLDDPIATGVIRVWTEEEPLREDITTFFLSTGWRVDDYGWGVDDYGWGVDDYGWGVDDYGWGVNRYGWGVDDYGWGAPIASGNGEVIVFDLDHILGPPPAYALQSLPVPPQLPLWLKSIGQAYRFSSADVITSTPNIMFSYLQREVSDDYEDRLRVYYLPDGASNNGGQGWQRLETELDTYYNVASAFMPGEGVYALIETIEMPSFSAQWNNFGYPVVETRPVTVGLASIAGYYNSIYNYDAEGSSWRLYDQTVVDNYPEFVPFVNDLSVLEFGRAYWIYATEAITLYLGVPENMTLNHSPSTSLGTRLTSLLPPATFFGWVTPNGTFNPTAGMAVRALIDGQVCGETVVEEFAGLLAYKLQVAEYNGCDVQEGMLVFEVGDWMMDHSRMWDNSHALYHPLSNMVTAPVMLALEPQTLTTSIGASFELPILVQSGAQAVDGASAYLNFDPTLMQVASITAGSEFDIVLLNRFDNGTGEIDFSAGTLSEPWPSGTFVLATVTFTATTESDGTPIDFNSVLPRPSDVTFGGDSLLDHTAGNTIVIENTSTILASVLLQGRPSPPHPRWSVPLTVKLTIPGESEASYTFETTTDENGQFILTGIAPGSYEIRVKKPSALQVMQVVTIEPGENTLEFGTLREGDANNDNFVTILDFSILAAAFGTCEGDPNFDERADFNGDGCILITDFSLLASNFGEGGEGNPLSRHADGNRQVGAGLAPATTLPVEMVVAPELVNVVAGERFDVAIEVKAGAQVVDGAQLELHFEPNLLQVEQVTAGESLPLELEKSVDNTTGVIRFAAGTLSAFPSDTFELVEINFRTLAETAQTELSFELSSPNSSNVTFAGDSLLAGHSNGSVIIAKDDTSSVQLSRLSSNANASDGWRLALISLTLTVLVAGWVMKRT